MTDQNKGWMNRRKRTELGIEERGQLKESIAATKKQDPNISVCRRTKELLNSYSILFKLIKQTKLISKMFLFKYEGLSRCKISNINKISENQKALNFCNKL